MLTLAFYLPYFHSPPFPPPLPISPLYCSVTHCVDSAHFNQPYPICPVLTLPWQKQACAMTSTCTHISYTGLFTILPPSNVHHHLCPPSSALMLPNKKTVISAKADGNIYPAVSLLLFSPSYSGCTSTFPRSPTVNSVNDGSTPRKELVIKEKSPPI